MVIVIKNSTKPRIVYGNLSGVDKALMPIIQVTLATIYRGKGDSWKVILRVSLDSPQRITVYGGAGTGWEPFASKWADRFLQAMEGISFTDLFSPTYRLVDGLPVKQAFEQRLRKHSAVTRVGFI
jgi:hypothetical protein